MKCKCGKESHVTDSRHHVEGNYIRRRRQCDDGHRFTTYEFPEREDEKEPRKITTAQLSGIIEGILNAFEVTQ